MPNKPKKPKLEAGPYSLRDGKKVDAAFHNALLSNREGHVRADMLAIQQAVARGVQLQEAVNMYAGPEALALLEASL